MSSSFYFSFGLLLSFFLFISSSALYRPVSSAVSYQKRNNLYYDTYDSNEDNDIQLMIYPKYLSYPRIQRSSAFNPRTIRNSWFRASTYQHMKPSGASEEKSSGDKLMRWG
ncbi:unnamed protein product [Adineta steineri]|uniref:Uncharacterized protein n=1 Tax=Adineta steineri TaxID=433720 RepID=A0A813Z8G8_9BILA|nr:unnamed protein product [Adineta steineri]CAF1236160.1 unnamed protein product [Adineta steineri]CAF1241406.1 unnamed protein product [Adineta steineri]CAF1261210.1 unnamed protein product [Adineta steineri]CAF1517041.1 unnamed protein product [Adineta steineri]